MNNQDQNNEINNEINNILNSNKIDDLNRFIKKRKFLNIYNLYCIYVFYLLQSTGILVTTIGTGYSMKKLIWIGIGLNSLASLIHIYEKVNNDISQRLLNNIINIKNGSYIDEDLLVDPEHDNKISI